MSGAGRTITCLQFVVCFTYNRRTVAIRDGVARRAGLRTKVEGVMQKSLFREEALEKLASPDELDRLMRVTGPKSWLALVALCAIVVAAAIWGFLGSIPIEVRSENGILIKRDSIREVPAQDSGVITAINVSPGINIGEGQIVARMQSDDGEETDIVSFFEGTVTEVLVRKGMQVDRGDEVVVLEKGDTPLQAVVYVPADDARSLEEGMEVQISPSTVQVQEFGYMLGRVSSVSSLPATERQMSVTLLENEELVQSLHGSGNQLRVNVELVTDSTTASGFDWSHPQGPPVPIANGTPCTVTFVLGERRPAEMVLPSLS